MLVCCVSLSLVVCPNMLVCCVSLSIVLYPNMLVCCVSLSLVVCPYMLVCSVSLSIVVCPNIGALCISANRSIHNMLVWCVYLSIVVHSNMFVFCVFLLIVVYLNICSVYPQSTIVTPLEVHYLTLHRIANKCTSNRMGVTNDQKLITCSHHFKVARLLMGFVFCILYSYLRILVSNSIV